MEQGFAVGRAHRQTRWLPRPPFTVAPFAVCFVLAGMSPWSLGIRALAVGAAALAMVAVFARRVEVDGQQLAIRSVLGPTLWSVPLRDIRTVRQDKPEPFPRHLFRSNWSARDLSGVSPFVMLYLREGPPRRVTVSDPAALVAALKPLLWCADKDTQQLADRWESTILQD